MTVPSSQQAGSEAPAYEISRFNALRHGVLSRYTVLPWEDEAEYRELVDALAREHAPNGPTEEHLVEELAGIVWRKRRLRLAEAALHRHRLTESLQLFSKTAPAALAHLNDQKADVGAVAVAVRATADETAEETADLEADEAMTMRAIKLLRGTKPDAYEKALAALRDDTREWWEAVLAGEAELDDEQDADWQPSADAVSLLRFLQVAVLPWYVTLRRELENRPRIRDQAFGEAADPSRRDQLARYEAHLDRKLERMLAMLLRLQEMRRSQPAT